MKLQRMYWYGFLFCLILAFNAESCKDYPCKAFPFYDFVLPVDISPNQEVYSVGDTIRIRSVFGTEVYEKMTMTNYILEDWLFHPRFSAVRIDTVQEDFTATQDFEIFILNDNLEDFFTGNINAIFGQYSSVDDQYYLGFDIVPTTKGAYFVALASRLGPDVDRNEPWEGACTARLVRASMETNGGGDNNIGLLESSPLEHFNTWVLIDPDKRFHREGGYAFTVE